LTKTYVLFTESGKEQYLAELLMNTVVKNNPESARRIYVPTKAILTKSVQTGQKWIEEKTILFPNYVFVESSEIEIFSNHLHAPGFETSYYLLGKGSSRMPKGKGKLKASAKGAVDKSILPVSDTDMERLRRFLDSDDYMTISRGIKENGKVRFISGPLVNHEADVVRIERHKRRAIVQMQFLGEMRNIEVAVDVITGAVGTVGTADLADTADTPAS